MREENRLQPDLKGRQPIKTIATTGEEPDTRDSVCRYMHTRRNSTRIWIRDVELWLFRKAVHDLGSRRYCLVRSSRGGASEVRRLVRTFLDVGDQVLDAVRAQQRERRAGSRRERLRSRSGEPFARRVGRRICRRRWLDRRQGRREANLFRRRLVDIVGSLRRGRRG